MRAATEEILVKFIQKGINEGVFRKEIDVKIVAMVFLDIQYRLMEFVSKGEKPREEILRIGHQGMDILVRGILTEGGLLRLREKMKNNIVLIGMPGVGKSSAGVVLAKVLGYEFVDSDLVIQKEENRLLKDIIAEDGLEEFIRIENRVNSNLNVNNCVIATGGSAIYGKEAMEHLSEIGVIVYLRATFDTIDSRLGNLKGRGVAIKSNQTLFDLYQERTILYEKYADAIVDLDERDISTTVVEIARILQKI
jgi:shikimate kinase